MLHRRGVHWPVHHTAWWLAGVASLVAMTATGIDGYGMELFSVHMFQHMVLNMLTPIFLVLGAPMTLLLRALPSGAGRRGRARRGLLRLLHSRFATALTHPAVTFVLFITSLYGLYFTPIFDELMSTWWGHNLMLVHFLIVGFLYFWSLLGVDPNPRMSRRGRAHAAGAHGLHHGDRCHGAVPRVLRRGGDDVHDPARALLRDADARLALRAARGPGDRRRDRVGVHRDPDAPVLGALIARWQRSEERSNRAADRRWARGDDTELADYNAYLQALARADRAQR